MRWCRDDPKDEASVDIDGASGVATGASGTEVVASVDDIALVSVTSTATDLWALGTLANTLVVVLPFLSCMSSCSCSTTD